MKLPVLSLNQIAIGSLAVSIIVLGVKYAAYWVTGSVALYSDALESIINICTAGAAIAAIRFAAQPPDAEHPYGHHKAEYMSAVVVGALIIVAAIAILREAYYGYLEARPIDAPWTGLAISGAATVMNTLWSAFLIRQGRAHKSAALVADGKHLLADVVTSVGVIVGVVLVIFTDIIVLDSLLAALVALNVLWSGWGVVSENASALMDHAVPTGELARIKEIIASNATGSIEAHAVRTRQAGKATFVDFHLVVSGAMPVGESHAICDRIEDAIKAEFPGTFVNIHVEPENKAKHLGIPIV